MYFSTNEKLFWLFYWYCFNNKVSAIKITKKILKTTHITDQLSSLSCFLNIWPICYRCVVQLWLGIFLVFNLIHNDRQRKKENRVLFMRKIPNNDIAMLLGKHMGFFLMILQRINLGICFCTWSNCTRNKHTQFWLYLKELNKLLTRFV